MYTGPQRRSEYRVVYPLTDRPRLRIDRNEYEILNLSEGGLRFQLKKPLDQGIDPTVAGTVIFPDGNNAPVEGTLLRTEENDLAVRLSQKIPYRRIVQEQLRLARKKVERF
jgi:hypothetical protein